MTHWQRLGSTATSKLGICMWAGNLIANMYGDHDDDEANVTQPVYMGASGPQAFVSDDVLFRRLDDRLLTY